MEVGQVATTERLLSAAELEFGEHGFHGAKLSDIAAKVGISRPSLLYHFGSKHALYSAVVGAVFEQIGSTLQAAMQAADGFDAQLEAIVEGFVGFVQGRPAAARLVLREIMDDQGPGQTLIIEEGVPLLIMVERFIRLHGKDRVPEDLPIRGALLQLVSSAFVKAASGRLEHVLWEGEDPHAQLARLLFPRIDS